MKSRERSSAGCAITGAVNSPTPVVGHQCPATRLTAGELAQLCLEGSELAVERVDQREGDLDPLACVRRRHGAHDGQSLA